MLNGRRCVVLSLGEASETARIGHEPKRVDDELGRPVDAANVNNLLLDRRKFNGLCATLGTSLPSVSAMFTELLGSPALAAAPVEAPNGAARTVKPRAHGAPGACWCQPDRCSRSARRRPACAADKPAAPCSSTPSSCRRRCNLARGTAISIGPNVPVRDRVRLPWRWPVTTALSSRCFLFWF